MAEDKISSQVILETNLQSYFLERLIEVNKNCSRPLPSEAIYYSSIVLDHFSESNHFFEEINGKVQEKRLGIKLLESSQLTPQAQMRELRDIGDTALFLCGHFSESLHKKTIDCSYYQKLGKMAYKRLNAHIPKLYKIPSFYSKLSDLFESITGMIAIISQKSRQDEHHKFFIHFSENSKKEAS